MRHARFSLLLALAALAPHIGAQPTTTDLKQVLAAHLQKLKSTETVVRTVLFQTVKPGTPNGAYYPFQVTATIHDTDPGYPPNNYYGQTCVGKMDAWKFDMSKNEFGDWIVQGRMTILGSECQNNPSAGVSAIPLATLPGERAPVGAPPASSGAPASTLYIGEYACYGASGLMAGMGFRLQTANKYVDLDSKRGGTYAHNSTTATITFRSGFLDGQTGTKVGARGFQLSRTVNCEPWR